MNKTLLHKIETLNRRTFYVIIALLPVWTFLATWLGGFVANDEILKAGIDLLVVFNLVLTRILIGSRVGAGRFFKSRLNRYIAYYVLLHALFVFFYNDTMQSFLIGILFNLRYLALFIIARYVTYKNPLVFQRILLSGITVVALFGTLQATVLPADFLSNFNYGPDTIQPHLTIDSNEDFVRINSTLRGPNPLGAYMAWAILFVLSLSVTKKVRIPVIALSLVTLFATYSRSAWLALGLGLAIYLLVVYKDKILKAKKLVALGLVLLAAGLMAFSTTPYFDELVLHDDQDNEIVSTSNSARVESYADSIEKVADNPLGEGPGTSGPASRYGDTSEVNENYFLQIAREVGIVGLALFISIIYMVIRNIYSHQPQTIAALSALAGFLLINMFLHAWADSTSNYLFWAWLGSRSRASV